MAAKIISCMGSAYRITNNNLKKLLKVIGDGKDFDLDDYAKMIEIDIINITDMSPDYAKAILAEMKRRKM